MKKIKKKIKSISRYIIDSLTPVSTKNLYFAEIAELQFSSDYVTTKYTSHNVGCSVVRKKEYPIKDPVYIDYFNKNRYQTKEKIILYTNNGVELTVEQFRLIPTMKRFISKKTLIYLFKDYVDKSKN